MDTTWDSITEAGDYIYDSVNFWEDDEPEQSEAIIIEEAVEVPEYAIPEQNFGNDLPQQQNFSQSIPMQPYLILFIEVKGSIILSGQMEPPCLHHHHHLFHSIQLTKWHRFFPTHITII